MRTLPEVIVSPSVCATTPLPLDEPDVEARSMFPPAVFESTTMNLFPSARRTQLSMPGTPNTELFTRSVWLALSGALLAMAA